MKMVAKRIIDPLPMRLRVSVPPLEQLEREHPAQYYNQAWAVLGKASEHQSCFGKINRDNKASAPGLVHSSGAGTQERSCRISRAEWQHCFAEPYGLFWRIGILGRDRAGSIILKPGHFENAKQWFKAWLDARDFDLENE